MSGLPKAMSGDKYGYLTLIEPIDKRTKHGGVYWKCQCECGNIVHRAWDSFYQSLANGCAISCGCKKDKSIGQRLAHDEERIRLARESLGQIEGTTMQGIDRKNINKNNKSGVRGVCYKSSRGLWQADLVLRGVSMERRYFKNKEDAIVWRKYLEEKYFEPIKEKYEQLKEQKNE